jgi:hypothetical protein
MHGYGTGDFIMGKTVFLAANPGDGIRYIAAGQV